MGFWVPFWEVVVIATLVVFAGLVVVVGIGGFFDILALFKKIEAQHKEAGPTDSGDDANTES